MVLSMNFKDLKKSLNLLRFILKSILRIENPNLSFFGQICICSDKIVNEYYKFVNGFMNIKIINLKMYKQDSRNYEYYENDYKILQITLSPENINLYIYRLVCLHK